MRSLTVPAVAGIPIRHELGAGLDDVPAHIGSVPSWTGSREREAAIVVRHSVGRPEMQDFHPLFEPTPGCTYFGDTTRRLAIRFPTDDTVTTVEEGYLYELCYPEAPREVRLGWIKDRAIFTAGLLARGRGLTAHACGFVLPSGHGVVCPGVSGAGKSTLSRLIAECGAAATLLSDDRVVLTREEDGPHIWGTPWPGDAGIAGAADAPLSLVAFLRHGEELAVRTVEPREATRRLMKTLGLAVWDPHQLADGLGFISEIIDTVPLVEFSYPATPEAARWIVAQSEEVARG